jgi:hypothetical protein
VALAVSIVSIVLSIGAFVISVITLTS